MSPCLVVTGSGKCNPGAADRAARARTILALQHFHDDHILSAQSDAAWRSISSTTTRASAHCSSARTASPCWGSRRPRRDSRRITCPSTRQRAGYEIVPGPGLLSRGHRDPRRAGVSHASRRAGRRGHGERVPPRTRHRRARRRHHRQAAGVGLVPARHPQRRGGGALRPRGHRRRAGPLPARRARRDRQASDRRGRRAARRRRSSAHDEHAVRQVELPPPRRELAERDGQRADATWSEQHAHVARGVAAR